MAFGSAGPSTIFTSICFHWAPNAAMPSAVNRSTTYAGGRTGASCGGDVGGSGWADAASIDRAMASIVPATSLARSRLLMVVLPFLITPPIFFFKEVAQKQAPHRGLKPEPEQMRRADQAQP